VPELPEVETIKEELYPLVINKMIIKTKIFRKDTIGYPSVWEFQKSLRNISILDLKRRGKYLIFLLSNNLNLVVHLRLSGQLRYYPILPTKPEKFERVRFYFKNNGGIVFIEPRALGKLYLITNGQFPNELKGLKELGLEPLDRDFNYHYLYNKIHHRQAQIKSLLLDQKICAGVGNIYSDEALFLARIHPKSRAHKLTLEEIKRLTRTLKFVLKKALSLKGSSVRDYVRPDGKAGHYHLNAYVYNREGKACVVCKNKIEVLRFGNRRSRFCPNCQTLKE
jgi:formamidopyrimidine-DNA glycosylase